MVRRAAVVAGWYACVVTVGGTAFQTGAAEHTFTGSGDTLYVIAGNSTDLRAISFALKGSRGKVHRAALGAALDSLGFFSARWDSCGTNCIRVHTGNRSVVDTIVVVCKQYGITTADSHPPPRVPFPFDAAIVDAVASGTVRFFAQRGFPFTRLAVSIEPVDKQIERLQVRFLLDCGELCRFGQPQLTGYSHTRHRVLLNDCVMRPGLLFDIRKIEETRERLLSRSYVDTVVEAQPRILADGLRAVFPSDTAGRNDSTARVAVPLIITDRSGLGIDGVVGFRSEAGSRGYPTGNAALWLLNSMGFGEEAGLSYYAEPKQQRLEASVFIPWIGNTVLHLAGNGGLEVREGAYGFLRGRVRLLYELRPSLQALIGLLGFRNESAGSPTIRNGVGGELGIRKPAKTMRRGVWTHELDLTAGSSLIGQAEKRDTRWHADFFAGTHIPIEPRWGIHLRAVSHSLAGSEDSIPPVELYRTGGWRSVRGYADGAYPFRMVFYCQSSLLFYLSSIGAVYILCDGGTGFRNRPSAAERTDLLGYGLGIRTETKLGIFSVEWARNIEDRRSLGRIHVRFQNPLAGEVWR